MLPFLLTYGREARLPTRVPSNIAPDKLDFETKVQKMLELQKELHVKARINIEKAQACQKRQYDAKHNTHQHQSWWQGSCAGNEKPGVER